MITFGQVGSYNGQGKACQLEGMERRYVHE